MDLSPIFDPDSPTTNARRVVHCYRLGRNYGDLLGKMLDAYGASETHELIKLALFEQCATKDWDCTAKVFYDTAQCEIVGFAAIQAGRDK